MLSYSIDWQVCDFEGRTIGLIEGSGGSITWDGKGTIQRVCRGTTFNPSDWAGFNPLTDWLMPVFRTSTGSSTRLGMFSVAGLPQRYIASDLTSPPEPYLADAGLLLESASPYNLSGRSGEELGQIFARICDAAGITRRQIDPMGDLIGEPVAYPAGSTFGAALKGFCELAGFLPPHFDRDGVLRIRAYPSVDVGPDVVYDSENILLESRVEDSDLFTAPNVWIVVGGGSKGGAVVVTREVAPSAPHSVANRGGRRVYQVIKEQGLDTVMQAQRLALAQAELSSVSFRTIDFDSVPNPQHDCFGIIEVNGQNYFETSWSLPLTVGGAMSHKVFSRLDLQ